MWKRRFKGMNREGGGGGGAEDYERLESGATARQFGLLDEDKRQEVVQALGGL